jgi:hypothetical protein
MRYTVGLPISTDAFNASVAINVNLTITINQFSPGPFTDMSVSFGDGTPLQNCTLMASPTTMCLISHIYTSGGIFTVVATPVIFDSSATAQINNMTVTVIAPFSYPGIKEMLH